jgi:hypothetical protein
VFDAIFETTAIALPRVALIVLGDELFATAGGSQDWLAGCLHAQVVPTVRTPPSILRKISFQAV